MVLIIRMLKKLRLLGLVNLTFSHKINNKVFKLPLNRKIGYDLFFEKEPWMVNVLKNLLTLSPQKAFIDVGVNVGQTLLIAKSIKPDLVYYGFEPNPICVSYLHQLIKINALTQVSVFPVALGDQEGLGTLYLDALKPDDGNGSLVEGFRDTKGKVGELVQVWSEKNIGMLRQVESGIIKIDVEGGELEVVKCLANIIQHQRPILICEILPVYTLGNTFRIKRQEQLLKHIQEVDYVFYRIKQDGRLTSLKEIEVHGNVEDSNYLFVPAHLSSQVEALFP